jgi:GntR family transcriptional regulator, rspAB operon transcriptional repressor
MAQLESIVSFDGRRAPGEFVLDRKRPAALQVYDHLHERIVSLAIAPGTNLSRPGLAEQYRISQTPIRDAIQKLEQDGLVEIYPQSRTLVARIDVAAARQTHFLRMALELQIVRSLALAGRPEALGDARGVLGRLESAAGSAEIDRFAALDRMFHRSLFEADGHVALWELVRLRSGHLDRIRRLHLPTQGKMRRIVDEHHAILRAIAEGDPDAAQSTVRRHLASADGTLASISEIVARFPDYF